MWRWKNKSKVIMSKTFKTSLLLSWFPCSIFPLLLYLTVVTRMLRDSIQLLPFFSYLCGKLKYWEQYCEKSFWTFAWNNMLKSIQYGLMKGEIKCTSVSESSNDWSTNHLTNEPIIVEFIDLNKAFNTASHQTDHKIIF